MRGSERADDEGIVVDWWRREPLLTDHEISRYRATGNTVSPAAIGGLIYCNYQVTKRR
jgi:hypothetical protein